MCGINGGHFLSQTNSKDLLTLMNKALLHRGPDSEGYFVYNNSGISMRRLSIIDLANGDQPIFNEDRTLAIVFNGEIYNFLELKNLLTNHQFKTNSDTEVILHGFEEYSFDFFKRLRGMFAFCIFDLKNNQLILSRDNFGEKPLYYYFDNHNFIFSSELGALMSTNLIKKEISLVSLQMYFQLSYIPAPYSIYKNVHKLLPGCSLVYSIKNKSIKIFPYQDNIRDSIKDYSFLKATENVRNLVNNSISRTLVSDVPLGVFLSGGIDSSLVTLLADKLYTKQLHSFHLKVPDYEFDESNKASIIASKINSIHHEVTLTESLLLKTINETIPLFDEPFGDESFLPTYIISKEARKFVKVVVTGDGADEVFGGYNKYLIHYYGKIFNSFPGFLKFIISWFQSKLPQHLSIVRKSNKVISYSKMSQYDKVYNTLILGFSDQDISSLFPQQEMFDLNKYIFEFYNNNSFDLINKSLLLDQRIVLEGCMFTKVDRASMLNSIETRSPLIDFDLVNYVNQLPSHYKISKKNRKIILKESFKNILPKKIKKQFKKGFSIPLHTIFRNKLSHELRLLLNSFPKLSQLINSNYVLKLIIEHDSKKFDHSKKLWLVYVFSIWYKNKIN